MGGGIAAEGLFRIIQEVCVLGGAPRSGKMFPAA
jgi:hypothetical protein